MLPILDERLQLRVSRAGGPDALLHFGRKPSPDERVSRKGLSQFRRRGLAGVKREFALHALAYNLTRAVVLSLYYFFRVNGWRWQHTSCYTQKMIVATRMRVLFHSLDHPTLIL